MRAREREDIEESKARSIYGNVYSEKDICYSLLVVIIHTYVCDKRRIALVISISY